MFRCAQHDVWCGSFVKTGQAPSLRHVLVVCGFNTGAAVASFRGSGGDRRIPFPQRALQGEAENTMLKVGCFAALNMTDGSGFKVLAGCLRSGNKAGSVGIAGVPPASQAFLAGVFTRMYRRDACAPGAAVLGLYVQAGRLRSRCCRVFRVCAGGTPAIPVLPRLRVCAGGAPALPVPRQRPAPSYNVAKAWVVTWPPFGGCIPCRAFGSFPARSFRPRATA